MKIRIESHARYGKCRVGEGWAVAIDVERLLGYVKGTTFANKHVARDDKPATINAMNRCARSTRPTLLRRCS